MKRQTFVAFIYNKDNSRIDFERFSCKRVETVKNNMLELWNSCLYRTLLKKAGAAYVKIYATPDGVNPEADHKKMFYFPEV